MKRGMRCNLLIRPKVDQLIHPQIVDHALASVLNDGDNECHINRLHKTTINALV